MDLQQLAGRQATAEATVTAENTALAVGSGDLEVFATPALAALMEKAATQVLAGALAPGQTTVGAQLSINHTAATPVGSLVRATATVTVAEGRKIEFSLTARDEAGEVGGGTHTRFVVDAERFVQKAAARAGGAGHG